MKKTAILLACILAAIQLPAQPKLGKTVSVSRPSVLDGRIIKEKEAYTVLKAPYGQDQAKDGRGSFWEVFSDRRENPVYSAPGGGQVIGKLEIGDKLRIAEIKSGYALVYTDPKNKYPEISPSAKSIGWVPMEKLLLWQKVLSDDIGISMKAVICADLDQKGKLKTVDGRKRYFSPTGDEGLSLPSDMHFYYIYKREGDRVLLGKRDEMNSGADFHYWVNNGTFVPWNSRTCLEPTWEKEDVEYFAARKYQWQIFTNPELKGAAPAGDVFTKEPRKRTEKRSDYFVKEYTYRTMPVTYLRYPILEGGTRTAYHCTTFGTIGDGKGSKTAAKTVDADHAKALRRLNELRTVNIVIVIDGTSTMKKYFEAVQVALDELKDYFTNTKVNVGVMIYRDKEDGKYVTECFPDESGFVQPDNPSLRKWLESGGKYGLKSIAKDYRESVYYGIDKAIDRFYPEEMAKYSNIMLVIGDCGDNGKFNISRNALVDKLADRNITLMGFQVAYRKERADDYSIFNNQLKYLIRYSIQKRYENASKVPLNIDSKPRDAGMGVEMRITDEKLKDNFFIGLHCYNTNVKELPKEALTTSIESVLGEWNNSVDYLNRNLANYIDYGEQETLAEDNVEGTQLKNDVIRHMLGDDELFERLKQQRALMAFSGYAKKRQDGRNFFKVIVFFPARELESLVLVLENVYQVAKTELDNQDAAGRDIDRQPYYDAMMKLARSVVAQDKISSTSYNEIIAKVFGLVNYNSDSYTLDDIVDPRFVSNEEYFKILRRMNDCVLNLKAVTAGDYPFILTYSGNNDRYYWLPSEYLPLIK